MIVIAVAANAVAQTGWVQRQPVTIPSGRLGHASTFDLARSRTVMFGGWNGLFLADTWEWDGVNWTQRLTANSPPARQDHALAADFVRGRVVLFGGFDNGDLNDTWEYDGIDWAQLQPANRPSPRYQTRMEYDAARARIVLFGGGSGAFLTSVFNDTWEWNGVNWSLRPTVTAPGVRYGHAMTYDFARSRVVLFGGADAPFTSASFTDTWMWDGTNWTQLPMSAPPTTLGFCIVNDLGRDLIVRNGGSTTGVDTWLFDHVGWRPDPRTAVPPNRFQGSLAHDLPRARTVLFGGMDGSLLFLDDTWEYDPGTVARWRTYGSGCPGTSGVPRLQPVGASLPIVGTTFVLELLNVPSNAAAVSYGFSNSLWNGNPLPFGLSALGMTGCTLQASPDVMFFTPPTAGRATLAWAVPNNPSLIGVGFYNQGFAFDPGINPTGATVSNAGSGIIGPF